MKFYKSKVASSVFQRAANLFTGASIEEEDSDAAPLEMGWALKQTKCVRQHSVNQRAYLSELYLKGEDTGLKEDSSDIEKKMRRTLDRNGEWRFYRDEWLSNLQIARFWSNLSVVKVRVTNHLQ